MPKGDWIDELRELKERAEILCVEGTCWNCGTAALIENSHGVIICECCGVRNDYVRNDQEI